MPQSDDRGARSALFATAKDFQLVINGQPVRTWNHLTIDRAIDAACGAFSITIASAEQLAVRDADRRLTAATRARASDPEAGTLFRLPFGPQDEVTVSALGEVLLTGRVDAVEAGFDPSTGTTLQLGGRDRAADLVDCSASNLPGEWFNVDLRDLARELAAPFGRTVTFGTSAGGRLTSFKLQESETAWAAIERACRLRGLLCFSDALGNLVVEAPGAGGTDGAGRIGQGENLKAAHLSLNDAERFSIYTVRGQRPGTPQAFGDAAVLVEGNALDAGVRRFRPLVVLAESAVSPADAETRAQWEATVRATRSHRLVCTVPGWKRPLSSRPWRLNTLCPVVIPALGIVAELLIVQTTFKRSKREGSSTDLVLVRPDAYTPAPQLDDSTDPLAVNLPELEGL